jgi:hypothetical protein
MIRLLAVLGLSLAVFACLPAPPPLPTKAEWEAQQQQQAHAQGLLNLPKGEAFTPIGGDADDSDFRGPMQLVELPIGKDGAARYAFVWMGGKHVVTATAVGAAEGAWKIDGKLTLARALAAAPKGKITLLQVDDEQGPLDDPGFTPLCGVRIVNLIALYRDGDKLALATTSSAFADGNPGGCSNAISYTRKKD